MANRLKINKPCPADLASLSAFPLYNRPASRHSQGKFAAYQRETTNRQSQSLLCSGGSQSQQSFSQGFAFSQPFSQLSQDDPSPAFLEEWQWRCNREGKSFAGIPPTSSSQCARREESSTKLALSKATNLIQKLNSSPFPEAGCFPFKELEKRLETLDYGLSKVITVLDSVEGDLHKLSTDVHNASKESEGIKQKVMLQESSIQLLLKEEEKFRETITASLKQLSDKDYAASLENLSAKLQVLPSTFTQHISMIKTDLLSCIHNELQTIRECIITCTQYEGWSTMAKIPCTVVDGVEVASQKNKMSGSRKRKCPQDKPGKMPATTKVKNQSKKLDSGPEKGAAAKSSRENITVQRASAPIPAAEPDADKRRGRSTTKNNRQALETPSANIDLSSPLAAHNRTVSQKTTVSQDEKGWVTKRRQSLENRGGEPRTTQRRLEIKELTFEMDEHQRLEPEIGNILGIDDEIMAEIRLQRMKARRKRRRQSPSLLSSSE